ncbi:MAG: hypothetical protein ACRDRZ_17420 [Pseudonocardiaceae bacterium]
MTNKEGSTTHRLRQLINRLEDRLFAAEDARGRRRGWQVTHGPRGFGRHYRDPRWDLITTCEACRGRDADESGPCEVCQGRGTVRLDKANLHPGGAS